MTNVYIVCTVNLEYTDLAVAKKYNIWSEQGRNCAEVKPGRGM